MIKFLPIFSIKCYARTEQWPFELPRKGLGSIIGAHILLKVGPFWLCASEEWEEEGEIFVGGYFVVVAAPYRLWENFCSIPVRN